MRTIVTLYKQGAAEPMEAVETNTFGKIPHGLLAKLLHYAHVAHATNKAPEFLGIPGAVAGASTPVKGVYKKTKI